MDGTDLLDVLRSEFGPHLSIVERPVALSGGYYTENYAFRVVGGPPGWEGPLVLRVFPDHAPPGLAEREATVQKILSAQGIPAPPVLLYRNGRLLGGREWFIMARLPGRPLMGTVGLTEALVRGPDLMVRLPRLTARAQLELHRVDAAALTETLGDREAGIERWLDHLQQRVATEASGLAAGVEWLVRNRPASEHLVICHGDLWGGNILVQGSEVTGVLDWTLATAAEPAFDVGFTNMSLDLAPIAVNTAVRRGLLTLTRWLKRRYVAAYRKGSTADLTNVGYYEALRCAVELSGVIAYRTAHHNGAAYDGPRPAWDPVADDVIDYFRARTSVTITIPPPAV